MFYSNSEDLDSNDIKCYLIAVKFELLLCISLRDEAASIAKDIR